jgi:peptidoglycan-associated lipoprotein
MSSIHRARVRISPAARFRLVAVLSALLALGLSSGCASPAPKPDLDTPPEQPVPVAETSVETSESEQAPVRQALVRLEPVYFDTDEATIRFDARGLLKTYAKSIVDHPEWGVITIDGHCDERGNDQYNQALGKSRAAAVERYLTEIGVPPTRIAIRTFGADRPAVSGHDERAWSHNRRSEFQVETFASAGL